MRRRALALVASCGWTLSVDAFASASNSVLPHFFARYAESAAEVEDAFTVPDWGRSTCPACGCTHHETLFAFPPPPLLNAFVAKARADGVRAVVVTPLSDAAPSGTSPCALLLSRTPRVTSLSAGNRHGWTPTSPANLPSSLWISRPTQPGPGSLRVRRCAAAKALSAVAAWRAPRRIRPSVRASTRSCRRSASPFGRDLPPASFHLLPPYKCGVFFFFFFFTTQSAFTLRLGPSGPPMDGSLPAIPRHGWQRGRRLEGPHPHSVSTCRDRRHVPHRAQQGAGMQERAVAPVYGNRLRRLGCLSPITSGLSLQAATWCVGCCHPRAVPLAFWGFQAI